MFDSLFNLINRLGPSRYLAIGGLVLIAAAWIFGVVAEDVATGDTLTERE